MTTVFSNGRVIKANFADGKNLVDLRQKLVKPGVAMMGHAAGKDEFRSACRKTELGIGGKIFFDTQKETFDPIFGSLSDGTSIDNDFGGFTPITGGGKTPGNIVASDTFRVRFVGLTAKGLNEVGFW